MTLANTRFKVRGDKEVKNNFQINRGLTQGDSISSVLFNLVLEKVIRESSIQTRKRIYTRSHKCFAYDDDVLTLAQEER